MFCLKLWFRVAWYDFDNINHETWMDGKSRCAMKFFRCDFWRKVEEFYICLRTEKWRGFRYVSSDAIGSCFDWGVIYILCNKGNLELFSQKWRDENLNAFDCDCSRLDLKQIYLNYKMFLFVNIRKFNYIVAIF